MAIRKFRTGLVRRFLATSSSLSSQPTAATADAAVRRFLCASSLLSCQSAVATATAHAAPSRFLSTSSFFSSQSTYATATATADANAKAPPSTTLFVSGLNKRTTSEKLREAFAQFGEVVHARVVTDRATGYSKGYGFVTYSNLEDAAKGIQGMDAQFLEGWVIFAEYARPKLPPGQASQETNTSASS